MSKHIDHLKKATGYRNGNILTLNIELDKTDDPNILGESIRAYAFKEEYGCYSCFELEDQFKNITHTTLGKNFIKKFFGEESDLDGTPHVYSDGLIFVGWWWDGDGTLCVSYNKKTAINTDCKKNYNWEWFDPTIHRAED